jgi:hypothetical protein
MSDHSDDKGAKKLSIEEKASIITYSDAGLTTKEIIVKTGHNRTTINHLLAAAKKLSDNSNPQRKKSSGGPKKVMKNVLILLQISKYPYMTVAQLKTSVPELAASSDRMVQHALQKNLKMWSRVAALKPMLTSQMKKKRMRFCKKYKDWTAAEWEKVMFSDESTFRVIRATSSLVRRPSGSDRFDSRYTVKTEKYPASVMVWGCFTGAGGHGGLFFLPKNTTKNSKTYKRCWRTT